MFWSSSKLPWLSGNTRRHFPVREATKDKQLDSQIPHIPSISIIHTICSICANTTKHHINITANARRTFIEVVNEESIDFLERVAEFIERIYQARYALSKYSSGKKNVELKKERLNELKQVANEALKALAEVEIAVDNEEHVEEIDFDKLSDTEKKQIVKKKITKEINEQVRIYLSQTTKFDYENAYEDFKLWIKSN